MKRTNNILLRWREIMTGIIFLVPGIAATCQDVHFSQFFEAPLWRNPSLAGIFKGDIRVQGVYRDQWNSITDAYRTASINAEFKMHVGKENDFVTTGFQLLHDRAGTVGWTTSYLLPAINYHKSLSNEKNRYLSLGFMGGWVQHRFDASKATTNTQYDGGGTGENFTNTQYGYFDGSVGTSFNSYLGQNENNNFFLGVAYHHFTKPNQSFYHDPNIQMVPKWVYSAGIRLGISDFSYMTIQADHSRQGGHSETIGGAMYGLKLGDDPEHPLYAIHGGAYLRWNDALIPVIKLDYDHTSISFSYDASISALKYSSYGRGGFEIAISWFGFNKQTGKFLLCPRF